MLACGHNLESRHEMTRTTNTRMATGFTYDDIPDPYEYNRLVEGIDRQVCGALRYVGGNGILYGGVIGLDQTVSALGAIVGGCIGVNDVAVDISTLLTHSKTNAVWVCRVDVPTTGPYANDPGQDNTFRYGDLELVVQDLAPAQSFALGTITLNGAGVATAVDNELLARPRILPCAMQTWRGMVTVTGLAEGQEEWVPVDHSAEIEFQAALLLDYYSSAPDDSDGGFTIEQIENCRGGGFGFLLRNTGLYTDADYGKTTHVSWWSRTGIPVA